MWWPAVAVTNSPPCSESTAAMPCAVSRRSAAPVRRKRPRRLNKRLARHHVIAAGQILGEPAQMHAREDDLGARRADVDADRGQRDVVPPPQRIVLERDLVVLEIVVVIVVVIGIFAVLVDEILAVFAIGDLLCPHPV